MEDNTNDKQIKMPDLTANALRHKLLTAALDQARKDHKRRLFKIKTISFILITISITLFVLPLILGKKLTYKEMDTAAFYEKWHYYTRSPAFAHPCDSTSPFWTP